ncbi:unnamed protein product [Sphagnum jensenii]|uniref:TPX2 C-terminal domain-containing protein n=1 Tax=Sphagnum jensenii TaxID=128206 RepID=A0ABP0XCF9_9BRYO
MDNSKSPFRVASRGHQQNLCPKALHLSAENCDPNVTQGWTSTLVKNNSMPEKSKVVVWSEKLLGQRELHCDGHEVSVIRRTPEKEFPTKFPATLTQRCRSPTCAVNNLDYTSPAQSQRQKFLKSKRHLLPVWHAPPKCKGKIEASRVDEQHPSTSSCGPNCEISQVFDDAPVAHKGHNQDDRVGGRCNDPTSIEVQLQTAGIHGRDGLVEEEKGVDSPCTFNCKHSLKNRSPTCGGFEENVPDLIQMVSAEGNSSGEFVEDDLTLSESNCRQSAIQLSLDFERCEAKMVDPPHMVSMENRNSCNVFEEGDPMPSIAICSWQDEDLDSAVQLVHVDGRVCKESGCLPHTIVDGDMVAESSQLPALDALVKSSGRDLFTVNNEAYAVEMVSLKKRAAAERKNPEDWMSDTLIKEAVSRLAPRGEGGVNMLIQAFESIMLMEAEAHDTKPAYRAFGSPVGTSKILHKFNKYHGDRSPSALGNLIGKVQDWHETMVATANPDTEVEEEQEMTVRGCSDYSDAEQRDTEQDGLRSCPTSVKFAENPFSVNPADPVEQHKKGRGAVFSALDAVPQLDDKVINGDAHSSTSSNSVVTQGAYATRSQAQAGSNDQLKRYTSLQPFRLRTEERGALKEYEFAKRLEHLWYEEQRLRVPVAQGLPWTTDEPNVPFKPAPKEHTRPVEFTLLSEIRAHERAEFDNYVAERNFQMELRRREEERMQQLEAQEEIRRMRRVMVPRAQLMPYFDQPFIPQRSSKRLTMPKEPNFHHIQNKKMKCSTMATYTA